MRCRRPAPSRLLARQLVDLAEELSYLWVVHVLGTRLGPASHHLTHDVLHLRVTQEGHHLGVLHCSRRGGSARVSGGNLKTFYETRASDALT